jgi:DNA mismatch endonuclease, patch repair protein
LSESAEQRSRTMRAVKSRDTGPELIIRRLLHGAGYRFRLHRNDLPGKPDLVFPGRHKIIFIHGCFWHGHDCARGARKPKNNADYWKSKIQRNTTRDLQNIAKLTAAGWETLVIWECDIADRENLLARLRGFLDGS